MFFSSIIIFTDYIITLRLICYSGFNYVSNTFLGVKN